MAKYFSYAIAYSQFRNEFKKEKELFLQHMSPKAAKEVIELTETQFRADCAYNSHNIAMGYMEKGERPFLVTGLNFDYKRKKKKREDIGLDWVLGVQNDKLKAYLNSITNRDLLVLTEITVNKKSQIHVAQRLQISRQTVAKIHKRILAELQSLNLMDED